MRQIQEYCRRLKRLKASSLTVQLSQPERLQLAELFRRYVSRLPPEVRKRERLAILGYGLVPLEQIPDLIIRDPAFANVIVTLYGG